MVEIDEDILNALRTTAMVANQNLLQAFDRIELILKELEAHATSIEDETHEQ